MIFDSRLAALVLCNGPNPQFSEELRQSGGQVVGVAAWRFFEERTSIR
jgi:hypothetical protein